MKHAIKWTPEQILQDILRSIPWSPRWGAHVTPRPSVEEDLSNGLARMDFEEQGWAS